MVLYDGQLIDTPAGWRQLSAACSELAGSSSAAGCCARSATAALWGAEADGGTCTAGPNAGIVPENILTSSFSGFPATLASLEILKSTFLQKLLHYLLLLTFPSQPLTVLSMSTQSFKINGNLGGIYTLLINCTKCIQTFTHFLHYLTHLLEKNKTL